MPAVSTYRADSRPRVAGSREAAPRGAHAQVLRLLQKRLASGRVLDIPCGSGAFVRRAVDAGYDVTGADLVPHDAVPENAFRAADMNEPLPFDDAAFDAVVSIEGIEHLRRPFDFVAESARVLKPGGFMVLTTPNISSLRSRWRWFLTGFHHKAKYPLDEQNPQPRHHINMLSYPMLRYMLHTSGFAVESVHTNRIKGISWIYALTLPLVRLVTALAFRKGAKTEPLKRQNPGLLRQMMSRPVLFGESIIIVARREE